MTMFLNTGDYDKEFDTLCDEYDDKLAETEALCSIIDPVSTPYESKYKARTILEELHKKLETLSVILTVNSTNNSYKRDLRNKISSIEVKLGSLAYDVEEPHVCERELSRAGEYYYPEFIKQVTYLCKEKADSESDGKVEELSENDCLDENYDPVKWQPPAITLDKDIDILDAMKCLNMFGILWSGRGLLKKSYMYLAAAKRLYHDYMNHSIGELGSSKLSISRTKLFESLYTHNLFYLAQVYGHLKELKLSCIFCQETLRRQYAQGFSSPRLAYEWAKNCMNISDFYINMEFFRKAYMSLVAARTVIEKYVKSDVLKPDEDDKLLLDDTTELEADIHRRQARLNENLLRKSFERENLLETIKYISPDKPLNQTEINDELNSFYENEHQEDSFDDEIYAASGKHEDRSSDFIPGLDLGVLPKVLRCSDISSFEDARAVFLRGSAHVETAKKYFVLDGYVTDHVNLLQCQSKLYHYLSTFEKDVKRVLAMETRRIEFLSPILQTISKTSYEALHKQISYELGETYLSLLDTKLDKFRNRMTGTTTNASATTSIAELSIDISQLKPSEIEKCNSYCRGALAMFGHFTRLYSRIYLDENPTNTTNLIPSIDWPMKALLNATDENPRDDLVTEEEIRPYLNAHFLSCRIISKIIVVPSVGVDKAAPLEACLKKYTWLSKYARHISKTKGIDLSKVPFENETKICEDMAALLPSKIYRMKTKGETGLTL